MHWDTGCPSPLDTLQALDGSCLRLLRVSQVAPIRAFGGKRPSHEGPLRQRIFLNEIAKREIYVLHCRTSKPGVRAKSRK